MQIYRSKSFNEFTELFEKDSCLNLITCQDNDVKLRNYFYNQILNFQSNGIFDSSSKFSFFSKNFSDNFNEKK